MSTYTTKAGAYRKKELDEMTSKHLHTVPVHLTKENCDPPAA